MLKTCSNSLSSELEQAAKEGRHLPTYKISLTAGNILISSNTQIIQIKNLKEKNEVKKLVAEISLRLLLSIVRKFPEDANQVIDEIRGTLKMIAQQRSYDTKDMSEFINLNELENIIRSISGEQAASEIRIIQSGGLPRVIWMEQVDIGILSFSLKKRKWIKSKREFWKLFEEDCENSSIRFDMRYKWQMAYLIHILKREGFIRTQPTKGHFKIVQDKIIGFKDDRLPEDDLKRMATRVKKNEHKYYDIVMEVKKIMSEISVLPKGKWHD
jgi:hypothetical protein